MPRAGVALKKVTVEYAEAFELAIIELAVEYPAFTDDLLGFERWQAAHAGSGEPS